MKDIIDLIARIMICGIMFYDGIDSMLYFDDTYKEMISYGITWHTSFWLKASIFLTMVGSIFLLLGYRTGLAVTLLALYWIPITFIVYDFWNDPAEIRRLNTHIFFKNMAILGALLMVYINGSQKYSVRRFFQAARRPKWRD